MKLVLILILIASFLLEQWLDWLNARNWKESVPDELRDIYDQDAYAKAQRYARAKRNLSRFTNLAATLLMIFMIGSGSFALVDRWTHAVSGDMVVQTLLFFGVIALLADILSMPVSLYKNFVLEENFGFNRLTTRTWIADKLRGYLLGSLIGGSLLAMFVLFYQIAGDNFWWITWIVMSVISLFFAMFYTSWILPMYNKLTPLPDGELRTRLIEYCKKVNFPVKDLFVMDGSKRTAKANAFFSGVGPAKKIVLFDTLINSHTTDELIAVLAHEVGHYKKKHVGTTIILGVLQTGMMLFLLSKFIASPALSAALGAKTPSLALGLFAFTMFYSPVSLLIGLLMNAFSRKHEYEADAYAAKTFSAQPLGDALMKLSRDQLSNLHPHPVYVAVYYSHPTLLQRLHALNRVR
jgi:STE24 endopeptidase